LRVLGERARQHGTGGAVQHGASTLPEAMFNKFPETQTLEIHLATGFQNLFIDHVAFPKELKEKIYAFLDANNADERKPNQTDMQFYYNTRKKALGPFKPELWQIQGDARTALYEALESQFEFFYSKLNVVDSEDLVDELVAPVEIHQSMPESVRQAGDDLGLAD
jgi:hypothetical protein